MTSSHPHLVLKGPELEEVGLDILLAIQLDGVFFAQPAAPVFDLPQTGTDRYTEWLNPRVW